MAVVPPVVVISALALGMDVPGAAASPQLPLPLLVALGAGASAGIVSALTLSQVAAAARQLEDRLRAGQPGPLESSFLEFNTLGSQLNDVLTTHAGLRQRLRNLTSERESATGEINRLCSQLEESSERFQALVLNSTDIIFVVNQTSLITYFTPSLATVLGKRPKILTPLSAIVHPDDLAQLERAILGFSDRSVSMDSGAEFRIQTRSGEWRTFDGVITDLSADRSVRGVVVNGRDVTANKELQRQLTEQAFYDSLTRLPNRALLMDRLEQMLQAMARTNQNVSLLFIDVDRFKKVNDTFGHAAGDALLTSLTERLRGALREGETLARFGGDEFVLIAEADEDAAAAVAGRLLKQLENPLSVEGREVIVSVSIGIATATGAPDSPEEILRRADIALSQAKSEGRGRFVVYHPTSDAFTPERLALEADLRGAAERGELVLHYQPYVELSSGEVRGVEALVRWNHPTRGRISPDDFIPGAEETGTIVEIGRWVLGEACRQARRWHQGVPASRQVILNVNLSPRELREPGILEHVRRTLRETGLAPSKLQIEITEGALVDKTDAASTLAQLKDIGVRLAMDDFGTGYSSLSYLARFPLDSVKIDRAFVSGLGSDPRSEAICRSIVALGQSLHMDIVAEGIEEDVQFETLRELGCTAGQGWLIARPVPGDAIPDLFAELSLRSGTNEEQAA